MTLLMVNIMQCQAEEMPSLELFEFLAESERIDGEWIDPVLVESILEEGFKQETSGQKGQKTDEK